MKVKNCLLLFSKWPHALNIQILKGSIDASDNTISFRVCLKLWQNLGPNSFVWSGAPVKSPNVDIRPGLDRNFAVAHKLSPPFSEWPNVLCRTKLRKSTYIKTRKYPILPLPLLTHYPVYLERLVLRALKSLLHNDCT